MNAYCTTIKLLIATSLMNLDENSNYLLQIINNPFQLAYYQVMLIFRVIKIAFNLKIIL